jgi:hypothetical protein
MDNDAMAGTGEEKWRKTGKCGGFGFEGFRLTNEYWEELELNRISQSGK